MYMCNCVTNVQVCVTTSDASIRDFTNIPIITLDIQLYTDTDLIYLHVPSGFWFLQWKGACSQYIIN